MGTSTLKLYDSETVLTALAGGDDALDERTFRHSPWLWVSLIDSLSVDIVSEALCLQHLACYLSSFSLGSSSSQDLYGKIGERLFCFWLKITAVQAIFERLVHSKAQWTWSAVRDCTCILTAWIMWANGHFPCGDWPEIEVFRTGLKDRLAEGERAEADDGYQGEWPLKCKVPAASDLETEEVAHSQKPCCSRQEVA